MEANVQVLLQMVKLYRLIFIANKTAPCTPQRLGDKFDKTALTTRKGLHQEHDTTHSALTLP